MKPFQASLLRSQLAGELMPQKVAIFRALQLGDLLCTVPAMRALRAALPQAHVTLIGLPWAASFVRRFAAYLDDFIEFPGYPGLPERVPDIKAFPQFLDTVQRRQFDLLIQLHGSGSVLNNVLALFGAKRMAGFYTPDAYVPDRHDFVPHPEKETEIRRYLQLLESIGIPAQGEHLEFPIFAEDVRAFEQIDEIAGLRAGTFVCVHPGARWVSRRWTAQGFAHVADRLAAEGLKVVLTGSDEERPLVEAVAAQMKSKSIDGAGRTPLGPFAVLLQRARLLVSNDTGVSHVAAALRTPSVVVCMGSDIERWAPSDRLLHRTVSHPVDCRPCDYRVCPIGHPCAVDLDPESVFQQARALLEQSVAHSN